MTRDQYLAALVVGCLWFATVAYLWSSLGCSTSNPC